MQHQQWARRSFSQPALLILANLSQEPKHAIALQEVIEQAEGLYIEPGTLYRVLAHLEQRGWIESITTERPLRLYSITSLGLIAFQQAGTNHQGEKFREGGDPDARKGKEIIMRLVLWMLRFYPTGWRERYEAEMIALLEQHQITLWTVLDLLMGALDARLDPHYRRARQLLDLRRFQTSWRLVVVGLVAFWIALLPWFWMSVLGLGPDTRCSDWQNNNALCMLRVTVGMHATSLGHTLVGAILTALPLVFMAFLAILVLARGKKARTHLLLILPVTIGMLVLCLACAGWLAALWPLLTQISQFYPHATAGLLAGLVGMGLATLLALGSLARAAFALKALSAASLRQESRPFSSDQQASEAAQDADTPHVELPTASASRSRASRVSKRWSVALVALLLLFAFPLPILVPFDGSGLLFWLITWCPAGIVAFITALLVKLPDKQQAQRAPRKPRCATSPLVWAAILPLVFFLFTPDWSNIPSDSALPVQPWVKLLLYFFFAAFVSGMTALVVTIRRNFPRFERILRYVGIGGACVLCILMVLTTGSLPPWGGPGGWLVVSCLCIIPALFVRVPRGNLQAERATRPFSVGAAPKVWARFLLILLLVFMLRRLGPAILLITNLLLLMAISILPALMVMIRNSNHQAESATEPVSNSLSPRVWIIVTPILFLVFCMYFEFLFVPDYPDFSEALSAWFLTGLASLIMFLALKLGSRASTDLPPQEARRLAQVQG